MAAAYLTLSDLVSTIGESNVLKLLDDDNDGVVDAGALADVLSSAERYVAGYVSRVYPMAAILNDADSLEHVRTLARHIAAEYAYRRRVEFATRDGTPYHGAYDETVKTLKDIGAGKYRIDVNGDPAVPANTGGGPRYGTVDNLATYVPFARNGPGLF